MDSPLTKVIKAIISISETPELNEDEIEGLDYAVFLLSSAKVYIPVFGSSGETDVTKWLNGMLTNGKSEISGTVEQTVRAQIMPLALKSTNSFVSDCLKDISNWSFDIFELAKVSNGRPLLFLGMALFEAYGIQSALHVDPSHMESFLTAVEGSYRAKNTYHNSTHAADVLHSMHYYMDVIGLRKYLSALDIFSCIISAAIHDVDHPGFNNAYMVATDSDLALRYNDQTVLENHHCFKGFDIIFNRPNCNLLQSFPNDLRHKLRQTVISMVLATDMSNHFEYIGKFKNKFNGAGLDFGDAKDVQLVLDVAIKCADISNASKDTSLCVKWAGLIMTEFFNQGDQERLRGWPISKFMDRETTVSGKCQIGFIDFIVLPLYEAWEKFINVDGNWPAIDNLHTNREYWKTTFQ